MGKYNNESYLRAEDLLIGGKYHRAVLEIEDVLTGAPLTRRLKPVEGLALKFKGKDKVLGLGTTNESLCKVVFGDASPDKWRGKTVTIEVRRVRAKTGTQPAIRVIPLPGTELRSGLAREIGEAYE